jgi:hypothetical protein
MSITVDPHEVKVLRTSWHFCDFFIGMGRHDTHFEWCNPYLFLHGKIRDPGSGIRAISSTDRIPDPAPRTPESGLVVFRWRLTSPPAVVY